VVDTDGTVYVTTHNYGKGDADAPSKVFAFAPDGTLLRDYVFEGQNLDEDHGILALAFDADGCSMSSTATRPACSPLIP
jgi:outer membrane protein assembly factor BamB